MTTPIDSIEKLDQMRAKVLRAGRLIRPDRGATWDKLPEAVRNEYLSEARAIRAADEKAGLAIVPKEATAEMIKSGALSTAVGLIWHRMLASSPFKEQG